MKPGAAPIGMRSVLIRWIHRIPDDAIPFGPLLSSGAKPFALTASIVNRGSVVGENLSLMRFHVIAARWDNRAAEAVGAHDSVGEKSSKSPRAIGPKVLALPSTSSLMCFFCPVKERLQNVEVDEVVHVIRWEDALASRFRTCKPAPIPGEFHKFVQATSFQDFHLLLDVTGYARFADPVLICRTNQAAGGESVSADPAIPYPFHGRMDRGGLSHLCLPKEEREHRYQYVIILVGDPVAPGAHQGAQVTLSTLGSPAHRQVRVIPGQLGPSPVGPLLDARRTGLPRLIHQAWSVST